MKSFQQFTLLSFLFVSTLVSAQVPDPEIEAAEAAMNEGVNKCIIVHFTDISERDAEKIWQDYSKLRLGDKAKKIRKTNEYLSEEASVNGLSGEQRVTVSFEEEGNSTEMHIWVDRGDGFVNPEDHPSDYSSVREMLYNFNRTIEKHKVEEVLDKEEKILKELNRDLKGLEKDKDKLEDNIKKYEDDIKDAEKRIPKNETEQEDKLIEIERLTGELEGDDKLSKSLKKELKKLKKEKQKLNDLIKKNQKRIEKAQEDIEQNGLDQEAKATEIKIQEGVVDEVKERLRNIGA